MQDTLMSIQIIPKTPNNNDVIPYVDEAIKIIDLIQKLNDRMVELECPSIISQVKFYHVPEGIEIETLTGKYD
ncbi:MAG: thiamine-binding protein [Staphylococcus epidermidis]|nr:thiamine-binding protein [Staphylococcus epidermidis]